MDTIEFPGLWGLKFNISKEAFSVFNIPIFWYGIIIAFGFLLAVLLAMRSSKKYGLEPDNIIDLVLYAAPVAIVTARLYYVVFSWESFKDNPLDIFDTRKGGLAIYGAVLGAIVVAYIFARVKKIGVFKLFDHCAPYLILAQGIGRWGNFVNQEAYGTYTNLPWGMTGSEIGNNPVHPTFLYESLWNIAIFLFLIWYRNRKKLQGEVFFLYMILYGFGRFWIEGLRTDSLMLGSLRVSQLLAAVFAICLTIVFFVRRKRADKDSDVVEIGASSYGAVLKSLKEEENEENKASDEVEKMIDVSEADEDVTANEKITDEGEDDKISGES